MTKTSRCIALFLVLALLCGLSTTVHADVVTLGIYFCGRRMTEDGSETIVRLESPMIPKETYLRIVNGEAR